MDDHNMAVPNGDEGVVQFPGPGPVQKVFNNAMLLEMILKHVVNHPEGELISQLDICRLGSVGKLWLQAVTRLVGNRGEPYRLHLNRANSLNDITWLRRCPNQLSRFVQVFQGHKMWGNRKPQTYTLKLEADFFRRGNQTDFLNCLMRCGQGMLALDMKIPVTTPLRCCIPTGPSLPLLERLTVEFDVEVCHTAPCVWYNRLNCISWNAVDIVCHVNQVLNGTKVLKEVCIRQSPTKHFECKMSTHLGNLDLPTTITTLLVDIPLEYWVLINLLKHDLPNLEHLQLLNSPNPTLRDTTHQILNRFRTHLRILHLRSAEECCTDRFWFPVHRLSFPVMERLEVLKITGRYWELDDEITTLWANRLPVLQELELSGCTYTQIQKWVNNADNGNVSQSITRLRVEKIIPYRVGKMGFSLSSFNNYYPLELKDYPTNFHFVELRAMRTTMPQITNLDICILENQYHLMRYLFTEMGGVLKKLRICGTGRTDRIPLGHWDAVLIGIRRELIMGLREEPTLWEHIDLDDNPPSIRNLTNLESLELTDKFYFAPRSGLEARSLISDVAFHFGFLRMPALKHLTLSGKFTASVHMSRRWKLQKGEAIGYPSHSS